MAARPVVSPARGRSRWVWQSVYSSPLRDDGHRLDGMPGDCFRACLASLLEVPLLEVPHCVLSGNTTWWWRARRFVRAWSDGYLDLLSGAPPWPASPVYDAPNELQRYVLAAGPSNRALERGLTWGHVVVVDQATGRLVHDPHPLGRGLVNYTHVYALVPTWQAEELEPLPAQLALPVGAR